MSCFDEYMGGLGFICFLSRLVCPRYFVYTINGRKHQAGVEVLQRLPEGIPQAQAAAEERQELQPLEGNRKLRLSHLPQGLQGHPRGPLQTQIPQDLQAHVQTHPHPHASADQEPPPENDAQVRLNRRNTGRIARRNQALRQPVSRK